MLTNGRGQLFWGRRVGQNAWQFPQGGIKAHETPVEALYRELQEEVGLQQADVDIIGYTPGWLRYRLPPYLIRQHRRPLCIGQKQVWFLLRMLVPDDAVHLDACEQPEFDHWRWVDYWSPLREVVFFKRGVYRRALDQLAPLMSSPAAPERPAWAQRRQPPR